MGRCCLRDPSALGRGHPIHPKPHHIRDITQGTSLVQALTKPSWSSCSTAAPELWPFQPHWWTRARIHPCPTPSSPPETFRSVPKGRCWADKGSSTDPEVASRSNQEHRSQGSVTVMEQVSGQGRKSVCPTQVGSGPGAPGRFIVMGQG